LDLSTKIVYFVRATYFDLIRSSSGPPRRQIQDLFRFVYKNNIFCQSDIFGPYKVILRPSKKTDPGVVWISLLGGPEDDLIR